MPRVRRRSLDTVERILDLTLPLDPTSFILHVLKDPAVEPARWKDTVRASLSALRGPASQFAVETLGWDLREIDDILRELGFSICIDVGHLVLYGDDVPATFEHFSGRVTMIHLHGVRDGKDHLALDKLGVDERAMIARTIGRRATRSGLSLEVFSREDFEDSIEAMKQMFDPKGE